MNLQQLRIQIDRRTGKALDVPAANAYINEVVNLISNHREWPWLDATQLITITDELTYLLPADYSESRAVNVNGCEARRIYIADADDMMQFDDWNEDYVYTIEAGELRFFPQPVADQVVTHRYVKTEPLLSADTASPLIPERYHTVICDGAAALFLERADGIARADYYQDKYEKGLKKMVEGVQRQAGPARIRIRPGAWY